MIWLARLFSWLKSEKGQGMVEYGLILALVAVVVIAALTALGGKLSDLFTGVSDTINPHQPE